MRHGPRAALAAVVLLLGSLVAAGFAPSVPSAEREHASAFAADAAKAVPVALVERGRIRADVGPLLGLLALLFLTAGGLGRSASARRLAVVAVGRPLGRHSSPPAASRAPPAHPVLPVA